MIPHRLLVGTIGQGVFRSLDHGETFQRAAEGMFVECNVRALAVDPEDRHTLLLGGEEGVFISRDGADSWQRLLAPADREAVWTITLSAGRIVVGTCPARIYLSEDEGSTWFRAGAEMTEGCPRIRFTRVTSVLVDPADPEHLWAGVEIDGVHESRDGGRSWSRVDAVAGSRSPGSGLTSADIHALWAVPGGAAGRLFATTNRDLNVSLDGGRSWRGMGIDGALPWLYCRALTAACDSPRTLLLGNGTGPPGWAGTIGRSTDGGLTWTTARMSGQANSTIWAFAVHPAEPALIYAASVSGQLYRSVDRGASWERLAVEFGEVRALAWIPT